MRTATIISTIATIGSVSAFAPSNANAPLATQLSASNDDDMSQALPFAPRPKLLDGKMAGDVGFDPFGFAGPDKESLINMREAEIKHCRLAMLAVVG